MMLIRGVGPGLAQYGVTDFLPDPELKVYRTTEAGPVLVGSNDKWGSGDSAEVGIVTGEVGAFPLDSGSLDAAILFSWLEPGGARSSSSTLPPISRRNSRRSTN